MKHFGVSPRWALAIAMTLIALLSILLVGRRHSPTRVPIAARLITLDNAGRQIKERVNKEYGKLPLRFEANAGQTDSRVKYLARNSGYDLFLTPTEAVMTLRNRKKANASSRDSVVRMKLIGADPEAQVEGIDELPGKNNYFIGGDSSKWLRNVTNYAKVRYGYVYPGIDMIYYGNQQELEYDFVLEPGAAAGAVRLELTGVEDLRVEKNGDLILHTGDGEVAQRKPVAYQEIDGRRREIACSYVLKGEWEVGFEIAPYDHSRTLVIDPVLAYSTYLGGSSSDPALDVAVDAAGNAYLTGYTYSSDFPTENPLQPSFTGSSSVFISKLNPDGSALVYSTYLGGSNGSEYSRSIAVDAQGNACIAGDTYSPDFPLKNAVQPIYKGNGDIFTAKLNSDGSDLIYSTYLGGGQGEQARRIAMDSAGNAYVTGYSSSTDFPIVNALQPTFGSAIDAAIVTKLSADGSAIVYSTFLGGYSIGQDIAVDTVGNVYLVGSTSSADFPTVNPYQATLRGSTDAFVTKLNAAGTAIVFSTFFGGDDFEEGLCIAVDGAGNVYLSGQTSSTDLPTVNPFQPSLEGDDADFVAKFDPSGATLIYSSYLGGSSGGIPGGIAADSQGNAYFTGETSSSDFPIFNEVLPRPVKINEGYSSVYLTKLNATGGMISSTLIGGSDNEYCGGVALGADGSVYVAGDTFSADFITTPGAYQRDFRGVSDAFVLKISDETGSSSASLATGSIR